MIDDLETPDDRARRHLAAHHQVISSTEAQACGLTEAQVLARARRGEWHRLCRGVYCAASSPRTWLRQARAAVVAGPPGTLASHLTAAALLGLLAPSPVTHVTVPRTASGRSGLAVAHHAGVSLRDRATLQRIPCTSAARTIVDLAALLDTAELARIVDAALCERLVSVEAIEAASRRARRHAGVGVLRDALAVWSTAIDPGSPAEVRLLRRLEEWGFPRPVCQLEIVDLDGSFVARVDAAWPAVRLALEYDGRRWHGPRQWVLDEARQCRAEGLGWRFERVTKLDLMPGEVQLRNRLTAAFAGQSVA